MHIICSHCKIENSSQEFYKDNNSKNGLRSHCKPCHKDSVNRSQIKHRDRYIKNYQKSNERHKVSGYTREWSLKEKYNISLEDYNILLVNQNNVCAICQKVSNKNLQVDHDHKTGEIRGLLCWTCNMALGYLYDSTENLNTAIQYLTKSLIPN